MPLLPAAGQTAPAPSAAVKTGTEEAFRADVVEESKNKIVLAYFWSPKSDQSAKFAALLEKYVTMAGGKAALVKYDIDVCPRLTTQLGIRGVPTTLVFAKGGMLDGFAGALPESQLKQVMLSLLGKDAVSADELLKKADEVMKTGDADAALAAYFAVLEKDPSCPDAFAGMIRCFIAQKQFDAAKDLAEGLEDSVKSPALDAAKTALKLALENRDAPALADAKAAAEARPDDADAQIAYATALFADAQTERAVDLLLAVFEKDTTNEKVRDALFKQFAALGPADPVAKAGRRKMTSLLYA